MYRLTVFNNAEESLQDGSHLFSTQHPIAPTSGLPFLRAFSTSDLFPV